MTHAALLLSQLRADLLDCVGRATAGQLAGHVTALAKRWELELPGALAADLLAEFRAVDKPGRSVEDALAILELIPERRPGQILPPGPVNLAVPYTMTSTLLRDAWDKGQVKTKIQKVRELIFTQDWLTVSDLQRIIKGDKNWSPETLNVEGSPNDAPYILESGGQCFIYDGHHRLGSCVLLAVAKTQVYYLVL